MTFDRSLRGIKALTFDVQGTATDFWGTIVREGQAINRRKRLDIDWAHSPITGARSIVRASTPC